MLRQPGGPVPSAKGVCLNYIKCQCSNDACPFSHALHSYHQLVKKRKPRCPPTMAEVIQAAAPSLYPPSADTRLHTTASLRQDAITCVLRSHPVLAQRLEQLVGPQLSQLARGAIEPPRRPPPQPPAHPPFGMLSNTYDWSKPPIPCQPPPRAPQHRPPGLRMEGGSLHSHLRAPPAHAPPAHAPPALIPPAQAGRLGGGPTFHSNPDMQRGANFGGRLQAGHFHGAPPPWPGGYGNGNGGIGRYNSGPSEPSNAQHIAAARPPVPPRMWDML